MAGSTADWDRYLQWNEAISDVVYTSDVAGVPVYLDLEDEILAGIRDIAEPGAADPALTLSMVVKDTLVLRQGPSYVLRGHLRRLRTWHDGSMLEPPPTLALLAMLSLVAETMHEGEGMKPHNFYGRLAELLDLDDQELTWVRNAYRRTIDGSAVSAMLWDSLNDWLEMLEGNRGLPTATALGHEHVGLPLSQALVRRTDRERFSDLFALNFLPPRSALPAFDMENLISEWMSRRPCPASNTLERLWKSSAALRTRITDVALQTLATWEGDPATDSATTNGRTIVDMVRAKAVVRSFPSRRLEIGLVIPARTSEDVELFEAVDAGGAAVGSLELVPAASGWLGLADAEAIDTGSFLSGDVFLRRQGQSQPLRRRARRVVPMRYDDLLLAYVECERVQLGEEALVLVRSTIAPTAVSVLEAIARPGFEVSEDLGGLPAGWTVVSGVQVLSTIPVELRTKMPVDLNVLQPLSSSQVVLQGGLRLPGNIAKWSSSMPPELRVSTESAVDVEASLTCTRVLATPSPVDRATRGSGAVLIWDLAQETLPDGDYEITIHQAGETLRVETLRLRSADHPAVLLDQGLPPIAYDPDQAGFGLTAVRTTSPTAFRGVSDARIDVEVVDPPSVPSWFISRQARTARRVVEGRLHFPAPDDKSCMVTGAHYMDLPTVMPGSGITTIEGVCRTCGLVKRQPAFRGRRKSTLSKSKVRLAPKVNVSDLPAVRASNSIDWAAAFDAVCHVGAGATSALGRIASQMEGTELFGDAFERRLEQLGHVEIERRSGSLAGKSWEIGEPLLVGLADGSVTMIGFRSERMMVAAEDHVWACRGTLTIDSVDAPPVVSVHGLSELQLENLAVVMAESTRKAARYIPRAADRLCASLPPMSRAREGLPTTTSISARSYERWNPSTARFEQANDSLGHGGFRLTNFNRTYVYRTLEDLGAMRATVGDARVVKYLAAADSGQSLVGYNADLQVLYVPLGADLPGLYGRAAALASGFPPTENLDERILEYRNVSPRIAGRLNYLLMS